MMSMKKKIEFKLDQELFDKYKSYCEEEGYDMSKRLRKFVESEIPKDYELIEVSEIKFKPKYDIETIDVMGRKYITPRKGPNVFVVKTDITLEETRVISRGYDKSDLRNFTFYENGVVYKLDDCSVVNKDGYTILESNYWSITWQENEHFNKKL